MALTHRNLAEGEQIVLDLRSHWKAVIGPIALLIVLIAGLVTLYLVTRDEDWVGIAMIIAGAVALVLFVVGVFVPVWKWNSNRYVFTNRRLSFRSGLFTKIGRDIPLYRINDIGLEKGVIDRMLGCGTLVVSDATDKPGLRLHDVPNVEAVQVRLQELLHSSDDGSDDGEFPPGEPRGGSRRR